MKTKVVDYLPLKWTKKIYKEDVTGVITSDPAMLRQLLTSIGSDNAKWCEARDYLGDKYSDFMMFISTLIDNDKSNPGQNILKEALDDFNFMTTVSLWSRDKQVFRFDKDFIEELIDTDNLRVPVNAFDYLPYKYIYVDVSDCKEVCDKILCDGFFITVNKMVYDDVNSYAISAGRVSNDYYFSDILIVNNDGRLVKTDMFAETIMLNVFNEYGIGEANLLPSANQKEFHFRLFNTLVVQILLYLSSMKPDIVENEDTKKTYREPTATTKPKNKFSEIRKWDVGVRFGSSVRKWRERKSYSATTSAGTGSMKRPHTRRAHWHNYRFKNADGSFEWRPVWLHPIFVNEKYVNDNSEMPVTMHKTDLFD